MHGSEVSPRQARVFPTAASWGGAGSPTADFWQVSPRQELPNECRQPIKKSPSKESSPGTFSVDAGDRLQACVVRPHHVADRAVTVRRMEVTRWDLRDRRPTELPGPSTGKQPSCCRDFRPSCGSCQALLDSGMRNRAAWPETTDSSTTNLLPLGWSGRSYMMSSMTRSMIARSPRAPVPLTSAC